MPATIQLRRAGPSIVEHANGHDGRTGGYAYHVAVVVDGGNRAGYVRAVSVAVIPGALAARDKVGRKGRVDVEIVDLADAGIDDKSARLLLPLMSTEPPTRVMPQGTVSAWQPPPPNSTAATTAASTVARLADGPHAILLDRTHAGSLAN